MVKKLPEAEFGPNVAYRENSLLDNPRAKAARGDTVNITICEVGCAPSLLWCNRGACFEPRAAPTMCSKGASPALCFCACVANSLQKYCSARASA